MTGTLEEHYSYISDGVRTARLRAAVGDLINPGDIVADLGCGFGIIGLMCLEAGASRVWAIDETAAILIAEATAERSNVADRFHCKRTSTFRATLPEKVDVLVCDHVGYFGFDYGIIAMIEDSRRRLLKPGGGILPASIGLDVAAVSSGRCQDKASGWASPSIPADFHWLRDHGCNTAYPLELDPSELASGAGRVTTIDLHSDAPEQLVGKAVLTVTRDGPIDGLGGWFEAVLSSDVCMTNSPLAEDRINRNQLFLPFETSLNACEGDEVNVDIRANHRSGIIAWRARNLRTAEERAQNNWRSQLEVRSDLKPGARQSASLGPMGTVIHFIASQMVGGRAVSAIEDDVLRAFPDFTPSDEETRRFVRSELSRLAR